MNNRNKIGIYVLRNLIIIFMHFLAMLQANESYELRFEYKPTPLVIHYPSNDVIFPDSRSNPFPDNNFVFNHAFAKLREILRHARVGIRDGGQQNWNYGIFAPKKFYLSNPTSGYLNTMHVCEIGNMNQILSQYGHLLSEIDFLYSDINTDSINLIIEKSTNLKILVLPFSATYNINSIRFNKSVNKILIYNQKINISFFNQLSGLKNLEEILFWGCTLDLPNTNEKENKSLDDIKLPMLTHLSVLNCSDNFSETIKKIQLENIERLQTDYVKLISNHISCKKLSNISFFADRFYNFSTSSTGLDRQDYMKDVLSSMINKKRINAKIVHINVFTDE
jgi:hypothetical protein